MKIIPLSSPHISASPKPVSPHLLTSKPHGVFLSILTPNPFPKHHLLGLCPTQQACLVFITPKCHNLVFSPIPTAFWVDPTYWVLHHWLLLIVFYSSISLCIIYRFMCHDLHSWPVCWWNCQKTLAPVGNSANHHKKHSQSGLDRLIFQKKDKASARFIYSF